MNIVCRKTNCKHNKNFVCYAEGIKIKEDALCLTFEEGTPQPDTTKKLFKKSAKYNPYRSCGKLNIECKANCQFCHHTNCEANGITINSLEEEPFCVTYFKRLKK